MIDFNHRTTGRRVKSALDLLIVIVVASLLSLFTLWLLENPIKYTLYVLEVVLISVLYIVVHARTGYKLSFKFIIKQRGLVTFIPDIALITLPLVLVAPPVSVFNLNTNARLIITLALVPFLSGYAITYLFGLYKRFSVLERLVLSYGLGYFLIAFSTFVFSLLCKIEGWVIAIYISHIVLGLFSAIKRSRVENQLSISKRVEAKPTTSHTSRKCSKRVEAKPTTYSQKRSSFSGSVDIALLLVMALFFIVAVSTVFPRFSLLAGTDISRHYMSSRQILRSPRLYYPYGYLWFHLFLACFCTLSTAPLATLQTALMIFSFMPILAFYIMAKEYLEKVDKRLPIISTAIWSLFSGLAWIDFVAFKLNPPSSGSSQAQLLILAADNTYNGTIYAQGLWFVGHVPFTVSFTFFFVLLYLLKRADLKPSTRFALCSVFVASCFLTHVTEAVFFSFIIAISALITSDGTSITRKTLPSIFTGLMIAGVIYVTLPFRINFVYSPSNIASILAPASFVGISYIASGKLKSDFTFFKKARRFASALTSTLLILSVLSLLVWWSVLGDFRTSHVNEVGFVPWFFYVFSLGTGGLLALGGLWSTLSDQRKYSKLKMFVHIALIALIVGRIVSFVNVEFFDTGYWEKRFIPFISVSSSLLASLGLTKVLSVFEKEKSVNSQHMEVKKTLVASFLLSLVVSCGISSTLLCVEYWNYVVEYAPLMPTTEELEALEFLDKTFEKHPYSMVITISETSYQRLTFSAPPSQLIKRFLFYSPRSPDSTLLVLSYSPFFSPKYLYLHSRDLSILRNEFGDAYLAKHLLPNLPLIFNNSEVLIYQAPQRSSILIEADVALVIPFNQSALGNTYLYSYDILASQNYTVMYDLDDKIMQKRVLLLPFDYTKTDVLNDDGFTLAPRPEDYLEYVRSGGQLVILNTNGYNFFADALFTRSNTTLSASRILGNGEILIPSIHVPTIQLSDGVEALSYYVNPTGGSVPFCMYKALGNGNIFYVNIYPLIQVLSNSSAERSAIYSSLGRILDVASVDLESSSFNDQSKMNIQATFREVCLKGNVVVSTTSILLPLDLDVDALNITVNDERYALSNVSSLMLSNYDFATVKTEYAKISDGRGLYATITVNETTRIELSGDNTSILTRTINEDKIQEKLLGGSSAQITLFTEKPLSLHVRVPLLEVTRETLFEEMYFDDTMLKWRMRTHGQNLDISGSTKFTIFCSDTYTLAGDFSTDGSFERDPPILEWNEWSTLYNAAFYGFLLLPICLGAIMFFAYRGPKERAR